MDKMREGFEAWAISDMGYMVARAGDGYKCDYMNTAWLAWKASRAALCVELPSRMTGEVLSLYGIGFNDGIDIAIECIEEAGVSHK